MSNEIQKGDKWGGFTFDGDWFVCDTCGHKARGFIPMASHAGDCFMKEGLEALKNIAKEKGDKLTIDDVDKCLKL